MGLSTKKTTTTTTPKVAEPYNAAFQDYTGMIGDFMAMDPTQFVAPESQLQTQAFAQAQQPNAWAPYFDQARSLATGFANQPATQITPYGYAPPTIAGAYTMDGAQLGPAAQMSASGYDAPTINGVAGPQAFAAQNPTLGAAPTVNLGGYGLPTLGDAATASSEGLLADPSRIRDFMADYQNPYTQQVIDASLAKFDEDAGRRGAALEAQGAIGGAFGGSRFGIAEGTLQGSLARERADLQARLLDEQYKTAAGLAGSDASAFNQFGLANAQMGLQTALSNQDARNTFALNRFGAGIDAARYGADASNQGQLANQNMLAQFAQTQFGADTQSAQQFASALNNASLAGYQGDLQTALTQAGMDADSARYYADAMNQAGVTNMDALNQFALSQAGYDQQAGLANQDAMNNFLLTQVGLDADAARYYADALNQAGTNNANLQEQAYQRELQAAGLIGDLGGTYGQLNLGDLGLTAELGAMQRGISSEEANAIPTQLQMAGSLYSQLYPGIYAGQTGTSKQSGAGYWLPQLIGSGMQAAGTAAAGGAFSDRRLKTNIRLVRRDPDGLGIYEYGIFGRREQGVMADEVEQLRPWALGPVVRGYMTVDYSKL